MKKDRLLGSQVPAQEPTMLENLHRRLKLVGEIVAAVVTVLVVPSLIIGAFIIQEYTYQTSRSLFRCLTR
jgi:hypothetical protein